MKWNFREIKRQLAHLSGLGVIPIAYFLGDFTTGVLAMFFGIGIFFLSFYVQIKENIRKNLPVRIKKLEELEDNFHKLVNSLEREKSETHYMGAVLFFLAVGLSLIGFPTKIAFIAITVLAVGDSFSTIVGIHWGKHKTKINPPKSWEGTLGGVATSFLACLIFTNPLIAIIAAIVGMSIELLPIQVNDNVLIPLSVGFVLWGLNFAGFVI